eukprot:8038715-Pyramimonas_sp.AAC.1
MEWSGMQKTHVIYVLPGRRATSFLLPTVNQRPRPQKEPEHSRTAKSCPSNVPHLQKTRDLVSEGFVCAIAHT